MASNFKVNFRASVIPIEEIEMTDTSQTLSGIHSSIDKMFSGGQTVTMSQTATDVGFVDYLTTTTGVNFDSLSFSGIPQGIKFIFIKIVSAGSSGTPNVQLSLDGGSSYPLYLTSVNDCLMVRSDGSLTALDIYIKSSGATTTANTSILIGGS